MKYVALLSVLLVGSLLFINRDTILSIYSNKNIASIIGADGNLYYQVRWLDYVNYSDKDSTKTFQINYDKYLPKGYSETFHYAYHFVDNKKHLFFRGWSNPANPNAHICTNDPNQIATTSTCIVNVNNDMDIQTNWDACAEPFPKNVHYPSVDALEEKLVQFANNKGDTNIGITAKGEVDALAVEYTAGGVCAKFVQGCSGSVMCNINDEIGFLNEYKSKAIKSVINYHTHDEITAGNSKADPAWGIVLYDPVKKLYTEPYPSNLDLNVDYDERYVNKYGDILHAQFLSKFIMPDGTGYQYSVPLKAIKTFNNSTTYDNFSNKIFNGMTKAFKDSYTKNHRTFKTATNEDAMAAYGFETTLYKNMDIFFKTFSVQ